MNRFLFPHLLLALAAFIFTGCEKVTNDDKAAAIATVKANLAAMKERNIDALAETVHPSSPHFEATKAFRSSRPRSTRCCTS